MTTRTDRKDPTDVEQLLALAGPRDAVPAERLERMRAAVHQAWTAEWREDAWTAETTDTKPRRNRLVFWSLVTAAVAAAVVITVLRRPPVARLATPVEAPAVVAAVHIETGLAERKSMLLPSGGELRVDASSMVTIAARGEIHITKGALYLDSKGTTLPAVITPAGRITDIGTRFEVRVFTSAGDVTRYDTRVRVRDGKVRLAEASAVIEVAAAEELFVRPGGSDASVASLTRRRVNPYGAEWAWVARAAPRFELEGKSLGSFLDWIEKEGGWTIAFASPSLERSARPTVLHGSVEDMSTTEALETILGACGLVHRVDLKTGRVTVAAEGPGTPGRR